MILINSIIRAKLNPIVLVKILAGIVSDDYAYLCLLVEFAVLFVLLQLIAIALSRFSLTSVKGKSMAPFIDHGDLVIRQRLLRDCDKKLLRVGDIITFERDGVKCIKRVVGVGVSSLS